MAGIATRVGPLDRVDRPRGRQERLDGRVLGQRARPYVPARRTTPRPWRADVRAARAARGGQRADPRDGRAARRRLYDRSSLADPLRPHDKTGAAPRRNTRDARSGHGERRRRLSGARAVTPRAAQGRRSEVPGLSERRGERTETTREGVARRRGRWMLRPLRLCGQRGRAAVPPCRSLAQGLRPRSHGCDAVSREGARRGGEMRPALRDVPRRGRAGCQAATLSADDTRCGRGLTATVILPSGVAQWAEHSAVNRRVVGSSPTPRVFANARPCGRSPFRRSGDVTRGRAR